MTSHNLRSENGAPAKKKFALDRMLSLKTDPKNTDDQSDDLESMIDNRFRSMQAEFCQEIRRNMEVIKSQNDTIFQQQEEIKKQSLEGVELLTQMKTLLEHSIKKEKVMLTLKECSRDSLEKATEAAMTCHKSISNIRNIHSMLFGNNGEEENLATGAPSSENDDLHPSDSISDGKKWEEESELSNPTPACSPRTVENATPNNNNNSIETDPRKMMNGSHQKNLTLADAIKAKTKRASNVNSPVVEAVPYPVYILDPEDDTKIFMGGAAQFKMALRDYTNLNKICKRPSVLVMKLLTQFMSRQELLGYSWKGTVNPMTGQAVKQCLHDLPVMNAVLSQTRMQYPDFKMTVNVKKCLSTYCAGYGLVKSESSKSVLIDKSYYGL